MYRIHIHIRTSIRSCTSICTCTRFRIRFRICIRFCISIRVPIRFPIRTCSRIRSSPTLVPQPPDTLTTDYHNSAPLKIYVKPSVSFDILTINETQAFHYLK